MGSGWIQIRALICESSSSTGAGASRTRVLDRRKIDSVRSLGLCITMLYYVYGYVRRLPSVTPETRKALLPVARRRVRSTLLIIRANTSYNTLQ